MKTMTIGDIMPKEEDDDEDPSISIQANPYTSTTNDQNQQEGNSSNNDSPQEDDQTASMTTPSTSTQEPVDQPSVHHQVAKDHPIDQIMGDISKGVQTRSRVASFCQHYFFISFHEPKRVDEALDDPDWVISMQEELNNFTRNEVWELVERPKNHNVSGTKWVYRNKENEDGIVVKNKSRLVAQGYTQVEGLDFDETFAPVARIETIRILLAYACSRNIKFYQMDVKSAFLNGKISELVYVKQPLGFEDPAKPNHV
jgi:hypothetical protein